MSYPSYPEYKESEAEWLGAIPSHWGLRRLKYCLEPVREKTAVLSYPVALEHIESWSGALVDAEVEYAGEGIRFEPGDILFGKLRPYLAKVYRARALGQAIGDFHVMRPVAETDPGYAENQVRSEGFISVADGATYGAKMPRVGWESMANMLFAVPPKNEQTQITRFLDHQTARIDALIAEQQRLIELLKEKRQAVISHAVTKGLDPDVAMKDSGVEWLGEVPAHWSVAPLRWYATVQGGLAKGKTYEPNVDTVELPYLRVANVQDGYVDLSGVYTVVVSTSEAERYKLQVGDVLMNEGGDNDKLGRGTVWKGEIESCLHQNHVFAIRPSKSLSSEWLALFTRSTSARVYFYLYSKQSTNLASVSSSNLMSCPVPIPPKKEQSETIDELRSSTNEIDRLIDSANKSVQLLVERRSSLISAAVTGKIDVRDWEPPVSETFPSSTANEEAPA